jgi:hypothetical protein
MAVIYLNYNKGRNMQVQSTVTEVKGPGYQAKADAKKAKTLRRYVKVDFNLDKKSDSELYNRLWEMREKVNNKDLGKKIPPGEIFKIALKYVKEGDIKDLQEKSMSHEDKLKLWTKAYNEKTGKELTPMEFAIEILPGLKKNKVKQ